MDDATRGRGPVDRFIDLIEVTAAGFLAVVTLLTFVSVILRYFFSWGIPDAYDVTSLLLGILIFWGMAVASYRGDHITVDLLWSAMPPLVQRAMDVFAALVTLVGLAAFTWMFAEKVLEHPHRAHRHLRPAPAGLDLLFHRLDRPRRRGAAADPAHRATGRRAWTSWRRPRESASSEPAK